MKVKPRNRFRNKAVHLLYKAMKRLENENNADPIRNGEAHFLDALANEWRGETKVVFDVGANKGDYSELAHQRAARNGVKLEVHAFEPVVTYTGKGTLSKVAVSDADGTCVIYKRPKADGLSSMSRMTWLDRK